MSRRREQEITRHLAGEPTPDERRELAARLAAEPELRAAYERRARLWNGLELPPATPAPPGFAARVAARARAAAANGAPAPLPAWARGLAAAALVAGCAAGVGVGLRMTAPAAAAETLAAPGSFWDEEESLAAVYLAATAVEPTATDGEGATP